MGGLTDILNCVITYFLFLLLPIHEISMAYMKDAVFFVMGVLILASSTRLFGACGSPYGRHRRCADVEGGTCLFL